MNRRELPPPDIYATCPLDGKVLDYYAGVFDTVFVCFNPFIQPANISPDRFGPGKYPTHAELLSLSRPVSWADTMRLAGLPSIAAVDLALKTQIRAVRPEFMHKGYAEKLGALYDQNLVMPPTEGEHSPFLLRPTLSVFKDLGHKWAWVGDEFCTERKLYWLDDLAADPELIVSHANIFSPDKSLLWSIHWDSHFAFLCGSHADLDRAKVCERLEGFYCNAETDVYWSIIK